MLQHHQQFALLYSDRTGSKLCKTALESHPSIYWIEDEYWSTPRIEKKGAIQSDINGVWGFKLYHPLLHKEGRLSEVVCKKIITYRHNKLSQYISYRLAGRDGAWMGGSYKDKKLWIDIDQCLAQIRYWTESEAELREMDDCLWVEYGELATGACFDKMLEFIGLLPATLKPSTQKQAKGANINYVENVAQLLNSELAGWV